MAASDLWLRRTAFCVCDYATGSRKAPPGGSGASWLRLVSFSFFVSFLQSFINFLSGLVYLFCFPLLGIVCFRGLPTRNGRVSAGCEGVGAEYGERGRVGRIASGLSSFKTEIGRRKKKSPKVSLAFTLSLPLWFTLTEKDSYRVFNLGRLCCHEVGD